MDRIFFVLIWVSQDIDIETGDKLGNWHVAWFGSDETEARSKFAEIVPDVEDARFVDSCKGVTDGN